MDGKLALGDEGKWLPRNFRKANGCPLKQRSQQQFADIFRQRSHRTGDQGRRSTEEAGHRQWLFQPLRFHQVISRTLVNLEVEPQVTRIVTLHPVHAEIVPSIDRMFGVDKRQGDEGATILGPTGDDG